MRESPGALRIPAERIRLADADAGAAAAAAAAGRREAREEEQRAGGLVLVVGQLRPCAWRSKVCSLGTAPSSSQQARRPVLSRVMRSVGTSSAPLPTAVMKSTDWLPGAEKLSVKEYVPALPAIGRVSTTVRRPPSTELRSTVTDGGSSVPGLWSASRRSLYGAPPDRQKFRAGSVCRDMGERERGEM